jgi:hypothetical protein
VTVACVVLAHRDADHVARLIDRLAPNPVVVHVDAGAADAVAAEFAAVARARPQVRLAERVASGWASWALVEAALNGVRAACELPGWSHVALLTGQDYPLRSGPGLSDYLAGYAGRSFVRHRPMPGRAYGRRESLRRVRNYNVRLGTRRLSLPARRRPPAGVVVRSGPMYWVLARAHAETVLETARDRPDLVRFMRRCWIPDELFVPTVAANFLPAQEVINECVTFYRWTVPNTPHPDTLRRADLPLLRTAASEPSEIGGKARIKLFARKFDARVDAGVLDEIDASLLG